PLQYQANGTPADLESMFKGVGTSYQGDFIWFQLGPASPCDFGTRGGRFGTFMRPANKIPDSGQTTLFYEARFAHAVMHTQEFINGGAFGFSNAATVMGSHGKIGQFNVAFADGHGASITVKRTGTMTDPNSFDINRYPLRAVMARGQDWRYDCFPAELLI